MSEETTYLLQIFDGEGWGVVVTREIVGWKAVQHAILALPQQTRMQVREKEAE